MTIIVSAKDPDVAKTYELNLIELLSGVLYRRSWFGVGDIVRSPRGGVYFECTKAGETPDQYLHSYPREVGETFRDGTTEWESKHPSDLTLPDVQSVVWTVPTGLTLDSQSQSARVISVQLSGGADGVDYDVTARITPTVGDAEDVTITVPVRSQ